MRSSFSSGWRQLPSVKNGPSLSRSSCSSPALCPSVDRYLMSTAWGSLRHPRSSRAARGPGASKATARALGCMTCVAAATAVIRAPSRATSAHALALPSAPQGVCGARWCQACGTPHSLRRSYTSMLLWWWASLSRRCTQRSMPASGAPRELHALALPLAHVSVRAMGRWAPPWAPLQLELAARADWRACPGMFAACGARKKKKEHET